MALEDDYSAKAEAHIIATTIRQMYNPTLIDDFDYTFGTGALAIDFGDYGNYIKTVSYHMEDGSGGITKLYYSRIKKGERPYIQVTSVGARSYSGRKYHYLGIISYAGTSFSFEGAQMVGYTFENYIDESVNYNAFPDTGGAASLDGGTTAEFYFSSGKTFTITNNVYETNWTDEYGENHYLEAFDMQASGLSERNKHFSSGR